MENFAHKIRPNDLDQVIGQGHILGKDKLINKIIENQNIPNLIFFGPPGVGKTTVAEILAKNTNKEFYKLNATTASISDIKDIIKKSEQTDLGVLLYLDEIQAFNKKQQQALLDFLETGQITMIASTADNPYHQVYKAILSRSTVIEFKPLTELEIRESIYKAAKRFDPNLTIDKEVYKQIAQKSGGDMRSALNILELLINIEPNHITSETLNTLNINPRYNFDFDSDEHYNLLSAFQKSIRGSDVNASLYYLGKLIVGGDLTSIVRRLLVISVEDISLADPDAVIFTKTCTDIALHVGLPEAKIPLSNAVVRLSLAKKDNKAYKAISEVIDLCKKTSYDIPAHLKDAHYQGAYDLGHGVEYKYPHNYPNHYVEQQYLPDEIRDIKFWNK